MFVSDSKGSLISSSQRSIKAGVMPHSTRHSKISSQHKMDFMDEIHDKKFRRKAKQGRESQLGERVNEPVVLKIAEQVGKLPSLTKTDLQYRNELKQNSRLSLNQAE
jgi:hypothetical protein